MIECTFEGGHKASLRHITVGVILLNRERNKILLVKRSPGYLEGRKFALPGGYMDRDETTRETALREVREETGYEVKILELFRIKDNPDRPREDRQNVDFIYLAEALEQTGELDQEIENIQWFDLTSLPNPEEVAFDHYDDIELYLKYLETPFPLPVIAGLTST